MADTTITDDSNFASENKPGIPSTLNVLTILTFIGSAFELFNSVKNFFYGTEALQQLEDSQEKLATAPAWARKLAGPEVIELARKSLENRVPILILELVAITLCVYGAIEMRKLKKQGYILWLVGELLPIISILIFAGALIFQTVAAIFFIFPLIFIILYTTQRKNLIN
jgi:hypothetical protein